MRGCWGRERRIIRRQGRYIILNDAIDMLRKIDYAFAGLIGFFAGMFAIPVLYNIGTRDPLILLALPWVLAIGAVIGMGVAGILGKKFPFFIQLGKFGVVGVLNTAIDFGILNGISLVTGVTGGVVVGGVNIPGVAVALTNAYFWNKYWVFPRRDDQGTLHDVPKFLLVTIIGVVINSGIVVWATSYPPVSIHARTWLNVAKLCATIFSLVWNFVGYKFVVFRSAGFAVGSDDRHTPIAPL